MAGIRRPGKALGAFLVALTAALALATVPACSSGSDEDQGEPVVVGLLLPDTSDRYERIDKPAFEARVAKLCSRCEVRYANAGGSSAVQQRQAEAMLADGADVLVLAPVDPATAGPALGTAAAKQIPVVSYDRLAEGAVAGYVTFGTVPATGAPAPAAAGESVTAPDDRAAQLAALRELLAGNRTDVTYLPYRAEAEAAAEMALSHGRGKPYDRAVATTGNVPTVFVSPLTVTRDSLRDTVVKDGRFSTDELCAPPLTDACRTAGLT